MVYLSLDDVPEDEYDPALDGDDSVHGPTGKANGEDPLDLFSVVPKQRGAKVVPFRRSLKRGSRGRDVVAVKRALSRALPRIFRWQKRFSPIFGPFTIRALKHFQRTRGLKPDGQYGPKTHAKLARHFDDYAVKYLWRAKAGKTGEAAKRDAIVAAAYLTYRNRHSIGYTQGPSRMMGVTHRLKPPRFPTWADCSAICTWYYYVAGAPDPNGRGYDGFGFTGTMRAHGHEVSSPQPGDDVHYGSGTGRHVGTSVGGSRHIGHGSSAGPLLLGNWYRDDLSHYRSHF